MTPRISRRQFLALAAISGLAAGCRPSGLARGTPAPPTNTPGITTPGVLQPGTKFVLEHDSVGYAPDPRGCGVTSLHGSVRLADGSPLVSMVVRIWGDDPGQPAEQITNAQGEFGVDIAQGTPHGIYHAQLWDTSKTSKLSDVIVAEATGSCDLNSLTVNFVPAQ